MTEQAIRGATNRNDRGSSYDRARRRAYLLTAYRANVDVDPIVILQMSGHRKVIETEVPVGTGTPACRCYRCGTLLTDETVTVDRIIPGCQGGTYRRENIRPACSPCNSETGGGTRGSR